MPMINGKYEPLILGGHPPGGGEWIQDDWTSDTLCPTPGFNDYREAIVFSKPEAFTQTIDTITAECHKKCGVQEAGNDIDNPGHSGSWSRSLSSGWTIGGSLSGEVGNDAVKGAAGVEGSYSEAKETTVTLNWAFPHCDVENHWRLYSQPILKVTQDWLGKVYRYFKNARGNIMEGYVRRNGKTIYTELSPFTNYKGTITIRRIHYRLGRSSHTDTPCGKKLAQAMIPGAERVALTSHTIPNRLSDWTKYSETDVERMFEVLVRREKISDEALEALQVVLEGNEQREKELWAGYEPVKVGELVQGTDHFEWILRNREFILNFPLSHREAVSRVLTKICPCERLTRNARIE